VVGLSVVEVRVATAVSLLDVDTAEDLARAGAQVEEFE
jgi:CTP:molybdopterin cytidylyltransferase MocA